MSIDKTYDPQQIEAAWYTTWEKAGYFAPAGSGSPYCIMLPPPNVTGSLHMGHAFQQTLMDVLIRYHRMLGDNTLWQGGTDHAGIATQMVVERQLEQHGKSRHDLGRPAFEQAVWEWKQSSGSTITRQSRRLGTSMDWSRERFTMNPDLSEAVQEVFIRLFEDGLIYRRKRLVNWDPVLHTAISDLEVISEEESGHLWHIRYPLGDGSGHLVVATTRPETMLGDAAVAVNPDDGRYHSLKNKHVILPLTNRLIPVIEDVHVDPEFGTGCVKITPAHDFNDYEIGERHGLTKFNIFDRDAAIVGDSAWVSSPTTHQRHGPQVSDVVDTAADIGIPEKYQGLGRFEARKLILEDLRELGLLEKEEPHKLMIPRGDRSGEIIEPYLTDQWYVRIAPLAEPAIKAVQDARIEFVPPNWAKTYFEWMRNIQDWCISRQLWWGHRIPVWYDQTDSSIYYVGRSEEEIRAKHHLGDDVALVQDEDVLDTWFSSALWPFSTLGWPWETPELDVFYPTSVLVTGFDIIFFWVARMIMMGMRFMEDVPFKQVYIHGLVRDADGQKMSKSKGNILDPLDLIDGIDLDSLVRKRTTGLMRPHDAGRIEKATRREFPDGIAAYGTDALRFTFASLASPGRNINFDVGRIGGYRNFCNKLWNAARYVMLSLEQPQGHTGPAAYGLAERWIRTRLAQALAQVHSGIREYRFDLAAQAIHEFTWDEYCDWYLELSKVTLTDPEAPPAAKVGTTRTLVEVLEVLLRAAHPFMPFITEELWQRVAKSAGREGPTIMLQPFPDEAVPEQDESSLAEMAFIKEVTLNVRRIRAERNIPPGKQVDLLHRGGGEKDLRRLAEHAPYLQVLGRINSIVHTADEPADAAVAAVGDLSLYVPLELDYRVEIEAVDRKISELEQEQGRVRHKLGNRQFVERAPADVVEGQRRRLAETEKMLATYREQRARYKSMLN